MTAKIDKYVSLQNNKMKTMKLMRLIFIGFAFSRLTTATFAQSENNTEDATTYKAEAFGSVGSGDNTPFWPKCQ